MEQFKNEGNFLVNTQTGEVMQEVIQTNKDYDIVYTEGTFKRKMKYRNYQSFTPTTKEEKIQLFNMFNDSEGETATPLRNIVNKKITIQNLIFRTYDRVNEESGEIEYGVLTYIMDDENN